MYSNFNGSIWYWDFIFFSEHINIKFVKERLSEFTDLEKSLKQKLILASILEWTVDSLYFSYSINLFGRDVPVLICILIFVTGTIGGILSMILGGLGSFESIVLILLSNLGYKGTNFALSLIMFRVGYTIIPWLIGVLFLGFKAITNKKQAMGDYGYFHLVQRVISTLVFLSVVILILSTSTPEIFSRVHILHQLFPKIVPIISSWITFTLGVLLILLSKGIYNGVRRSYIATLAILIFASLTCILKGLDHEEAAIM